MLDQSCGRSGGNGPVPGAERRPHLQQEPDVGAAVLAMDQVAGDPVDVLATELIVDIRLEPAGGVAMVDPGHDNINPT